MIEVRAGKQFGTHQELTLLNFMEIESYSVNIDLRAPTLDLTNS